MNSRVMDHINWGYLQLGLFALAFVGLQVWWIASVLRRSDPPQALNLGEFRKALERIWARRS